MFVLLSGDSDVCIAANTSHPCLLSWDNSGS